MASAHWWLMQIAEGSGEHDDLVLAVALAVWRGRIPAAGEQPRRLL